MGIPLVLARRPRLTEVIERLRFGDIVFSVACSQPARQGCNEVAVFHAFVSLTSRGGGLRIHSRLLPVR